MESKRLYRSRDSLIAGVCAGTAEYFNVDAVVTRIIAVALSVLSGGLLAVAYVAMWAVVPKAPKVAAPLDVEPQSVHSDTYGRVDCDVARGYRGPSAARADAHRVSMPYGGSGHVPPEPPRTAPFPHPPAPSYPPRYGMGRQAGHAPFRPVAVAPGQDVSAAQAAAAAVSAAQAATCDDAACASAVAACASSAGVAEASSVSSTESSASSASAVPTAVSTAVSSVSSAPFSTASPMSSASSPTASPVSSASTGGASVASPASPPPAFHDSAASGAFATGGVAVPGSSGAACGASSVSGVAGVAGAVGTPGVPAPTVPPASSSFSDRGAKVALVFGLAVLFFGTTSLASTFVQGVSWWQFWPIALVLTGIMRMVVPGGDGRLMRSFVNGMALFFAGVTLLSMSTGVVAWRSLGAMLVNLWPLLFMMVGFSVLSFALNSPASTLLAGVCFVSFCVLGLLMFAEPGATAELVVATPYGREYYFDVHP